MILASQYQTRTRTLPLSKSHKEVAQDELEAEAEEYKEEQAIKRAEEEKKEEEKKKKKGN